MRALNRLYRINFKSANIIPLSSQDPLFSASLPNHLALSSCTSGSASGDPVRVYKLYLFTCLLNSPKYKISSLFCFDKWDTIIDEVAHNLTLQCWKGCKAFSSPDNRFCPWIPLSTAPADSQYKFVLPRLPYLNFISWRRHCMGVTGCWVQRSVGMQAAVQVWYMAVLGAG